jgi:hypothetical protein
MRIDARISEVYAGQQARLQNGGRAGASFSDAMDAAQANYSEKVDFTNMTRQELMDWMGSQIRSGKMTFDESHPFLMMTVIGMNSPADMRFNYLQEARGCIQSALSRNDASKTKFWEASLLTMQKAMSETE